MDTQQFTNKIPIEITKHTEMQSGGQPHVLATSCDAQKAVLQSAAGQSGDTEQGLSQNRRLSLRDNFSWVLLGSIITSASSWAMLIALAKLGNPAMVGRYSLGVAITTPILMFTNIGLRSLLVTDTDGRHSFQEYLGMRLITAILSLLITSGILLYSTLSRQTMTVVFLVGVANFFTAVCDVIYGLLQSRERMDRIAISNIMKGLLSLTLFSLLVYLSGDIVISVLSLSIASLLVFLCYDIRSVMIILQYVSEHERSMRTRLACLRPQFHYRAMREMLWTALPLGLVMGLLTLNVNIPRYFAQHHLGEEGLGIYSAMASLILIGGTIVNSLMEAAMPQLARHYARHDGKAFLGLLMKISGLAGLIGVLALIVAACIGKELLTVIYRPEYAQHLDAFLWLMGTCIPLYIAYGFGYGMTASRHFVEQIPLFLLVAVSSVISCLLLVPRFGMAGLGMTAFVSAVVQAIGGIFINALAVRNLNKRVKEAATGA